MAEAQCPAPLLRCSSFTGAVTRESTLRSGPVTAPLHGLAVPSLWARWWKSCACHLLDPWISQHPQNAKVGPCSHCTPQNWVGGCQLLPSPTVPWVSTQVPWPQAASSRDNHPAVQGTRLHPAPLPSYLIPHRDPNAPWLDSHPWLPRVPCQGPIPEPRLPCQGPARPRVPSWGNHTLRSLF